MKFWRCSQCGIDVPESTNKCQRCGFVIEGGANNLSQAVMCNGLQYDSGVIQEFAQGLYSQANMIIITHTLAGLVIGGAAGYFVAQVVGILVGLLVGGAIGFSSGQSKAFVLKLQAQQALCLMMIERNTANLFKTISYDTLLKIPVK